MGEGSAVVRATSTSDVTAYDSLTISVDFLPSVYFQVGGVGELDGVLGFKSGADGFGSLTNGSFPFNVSLAECSVNNTETQRFVFKASTVQKFYNLNVLVIKWQFTDETLISPLMYWSEDGYYSESANDEFYAILQTHVGQECTLFIEEFKNLQALSINVSGNETILAPNIGKLVGTITYEGETELNSVNYPSLFKWSSDNEEIAVVDEYGNVKPQDVGTVKITCAKHDDNNLSYEKTITTAYSDGVYFEMNNDYVSPSLGYKKEVVGEVIEEDSTFLMLNQCSINNDGVEKVSFNLTNGGKFFGLDDFAMVWEFESWSGLTPTLTWDTDRYYSTEEDPFIWSPIYDRIGERCKVKIINMKTPNNVESIEIAGVDTLENIKTTKLVATLTYEGGETVTSTDDPASVSWASSDESIALIDIYGNITPMGIGQTSIMCTSAVDNTLFTEHNLTITFVSQQYFTVVGDFEPTKVISGYDADLFLGSLEGHMQNNIKPISLYVRRDDGTGGEFAPNYVFDTRHNVMFYGLHKFVMQWKYDDVLISSPVMNWNFDNYRSDRLDEKVWFKHRERESFSAQVFMLEYSAKNFEELIDANPFYDYYYLYDGQSL